VRGKDKALLQNKIYTPSPPTADSSRRVNSEPSAPRSLTAYQAAVSLLTFGKVLPTAVYVVDDPTFPMPETLRMIANRLRERLQLGPEFNLLKWGTRELKLSFLSYPTFREEAHPALQKAVSIDLASGQVRRVSYAGRANPPILHRKETFLPDGHPDIPTYRRLAEAEEAAGIYADTTTIGFQRNWEKLLHTKGLAIHGHQLTTHATDPGGPALRDHSAPKIERHRTALSRAGLSMPVRTLLENGILRPSDTFFDYGCGLGDDVAGLEALGYQAQG
jgi:hypothetical protein